MTLKKIQQAWKTSLCDDDAEALTPYLMTGDSLSVKERLAVYQNAYWVRLVNTLSHVFPLLKLELGASSFKKMSIAFLQTHAPTGFSLNHLGDELPAYLALQLGEGDPAVEVAAWECMVRDIRAVENQGYLSISQIKQVLGEGKPLLLKAHVSMRFFTEAYNTIERWEAFAERRVRPNQQALPEPKQHVVWRAQDFRINHAPVTAKEAAELKCLLPGCLLSDWCDSMADESIPTEEGIQQMIAKVVDWSERGLLSFV